jgi:hypothetical protein
VTARCVCGCMRRAVHSHHVVYQQELRRRGGSTTDVRNIVRIAGKCHRWHHDRHVVLPLAVLPDGAFEFAVELMGAGAAYEYLRRRYAGEDPRLAALLSVAEGG